MKKAFGLSIIGVGVLCLVFFAGLFVGRRSNVITPDPTYTVPVSSVPEQTFSPADKLNINKATLEELCQLPGIGEVLAGRILEYRNTHGAFATVRELELVEGIGSGKLLEIIDIICVEDSP